VKVLVQIAEELSELIPGFLARKREDVSSLRRALESGELDAIARLAHRIKGEGGSYGFHAISEIGLQMERATKAGDVHGIQRSIKALSEYLENVEVMYVADEQPEPLNA